MRRPSVRLAGIFLAGGALALSGCTGGSGDSGSGSSAGGGDGALEVVASTNVYGNIMETVGGDRVSVTSIIDRPSQDPHSYEATARDKLAVSEADVVVLNGGGYDTFMETLVADSGIDSADVLNAVEISGLGEAGGETHDDDPSHSAESGDDHADHHGGHSHGSFNEHVWYSPEAMGLLAEAAAERLATLDPDHASSYRDNAATFNSGIEELTADLAEDKTAAGGRDVAVTEPVPEYLFEAAGLHNVTPADFTSAVEEGSDVPPAVLKQMQDLLRSGDVAFLAYNTQTSTAQTETVRAAAEDAGVPVLDFSETLPEGQDYLGWMRANVTSIDDVLR
ncbi:metal ABC transporter solute-binding protein, Zn/Mn family [Arthrobacter sunyaminii]|uniref:Zinc ABC transporter substrate-binding protein n=1 Tax=Arthrobacter sunyaminii TaxID=2816859 RepID=A0A975PDI3_9MICC|nr:zinc ABC transporter substrate-binding protein [Arthrobacter sunyaminii]MBO0909119.1 zinc ABC transporter substrate-binding protein [Arthrobacter sunyaminii]QWQ35391.1 zinc ABC transporter substrate-binding protein [Arthrobacter sunyaminii]